MGILLIINIMLYHSKKLTDIFKKSEFNFIFSLKLVVYKMYIYITHTNFHLFIKTRTKVVQQIANQGYN